MTPDVMKVAVCEYLLGLNEDQDHPFVPPTAINWMGDGIVDAILKPKIDEAKLFEDIRWFLMRNPPWFRFQEWTLSADYPENEDHPAARDCAEWTDWKKELGARFQAWLDSRNP